MKYKKTLSFVNKHRSKLLNDLQTLIKQPSISAKNEGIEECSILVSKMLKKAGSFIRNTSTKQKCRPTCIW